MEGFRVKSVAGVEWVWCGCEGVGCTERAPPNRGEQRIMRGGREPGVAGFGSRVEGFGFRVEGLVSEFGFRNSGFDVRVSG